MTLNVKPENVLFVDIETVPLFDEFSKLSDQHAKLWEQKFDQFKKRNPDRYTDEVSPADAFALEGGIFAEFGKVVCISVGVIVYDNGKRSFRVKSFYGHDEKELLVAFCDMLQKWYKPERRICGHNIKEFDVPYLCRRLIINGLKLPEVLDIAGKKPWEVQFIDTLELWKFGDFKHYTSLNLLTTILNIPSPKDDIDGSMVGQVYYKENNLKRIATYCEKDVFATAQVFLRFTGENIMEVGDVISAT